MADKTDPKPETLSETDAETAAQAETGPVDADQPEAPAAPPEEAAAEEIGEAPEADEAAEAPVDAEAPVEEAPSEPEAPEAPAEPVLPTVERVVKKRGGVLPALIGGVLAAALGFVAARTEILDPVLPAALKSGTGKAAISALQADVAANTAGLKALQGSVSGLDIPDLAPLTAKLDGLTGQVSGSEGALDALKSEMADLSGRITELDNRLTELEKRPLTQGAAPEAVAAYERELAAMQQALAAQRAEVEKMVAEARATEAQAAEAAQLAANRTALARLRGALDAGAPFADILTELRDGGVTLPDALASAAEGVATLAVLRDGFPPAAREALAAARAGTVESDRSIGAFLRRQLGARSVEPRAGEDPDAVLSRAEAALTAGHLAEALEEIAALPEPAREAMADWTARAGQRLSALEAVETLAQSLNTN